MQKVQPAKNTLDMDFLNSMNKPIGGAAVQQTVQVEEKEAEIEEINLAKSIEEIKHILNDPKYSHISWIPNNR